MGKDFIKLSIDISANLVKKLQLFGEQIPVKVITKLMNELQGEIGMNLIGRVLAFRSGKLLGAWTRQKPNVRAWADGTVSGSLRVSLAQIPYARIHEFGGTILPKKSQYLTFQDELGNWHKVKKVVIPKRPYLMPALKAVQQRAARVAALVIRAESRMLRGGSKGIS